MSSVEKSSRFSIAVRAIGGHVRQTMVEAFGATAYALKEGQAKPVNPHDPDKSPLDGDAFAAWRHGAQSAERYWHEWVGLSELEKEEFERAAQAYFDKIKPLSDAPLDGAKACETGWRETANPFGKGTPNHTRWHDQWTTKAAAMWQEHLDAPPPPRTAATGGERVAGYRPVDDGKAARVNAFKQAEEKVLRMIDALHTEFQNEVGDIAADEAAFKDSGYKRMAPEEQKAKHDELALRYATAQNALRWLALGKTDLEKAFMAVNRSIFRPARIELPEGAQD